MIRYLKQKTKQNGNPQYARCRGAMRRSMKRNWVGGRTGKTEGQKRKRYGDPRGERKKVKKCTRNTGLGWRGRSVGKERVYPKGGRDVEGQVGDKKVKGWNLP